MPGTTVDRQCDSSQQAVHFAAAGLIAGHYDIVVAGGGVESMSRVPMGSAAEPGNPLGESYIQRYGPEFSNQGIGAETIAEKWALTRRQLDEFALSFHERADAATDAGLFTDEIAPVAVADTLVDRDEGIRRGGTLDKLAALRPAFRADGTVMAANSRRRHRRWPRNRPRTRPLLRPRRRRGLSPRLRRRRGRLVVLC